MKRLYIILFMLGMVGMANAAITVKFQKPDSWTAVSLYTWGPEVLGGWPGAALSEEDGWYVYTFEEAFTGANLIFNNAGAGEQCEDYLISTSVCLQASNTLNGNNKYDVTVVPCGEPGIEVKFMKPDAWTAVSLYTWGPEALGGWPGAALTEVDGWYVYTFDASFTGANLIFNNAGAGEQTEDYTISESVCLEASNTLNANNKYDVTVVPCTTGIEELYEKVFNIYPNPVVSNIYFDGSGNISKVSIHTLTGSEVLQLNSSEQIKSLNVTSLKPGVYFMHIYFANGKHQLEKIVKF